MNPDENTSFLMKGIVEEAVEFYNKTRKPEAEARLLEIRGDGTFVVEFKGVFCYTCGVRDWLEDLAYILTSMGYEASLIEMVEAGENRRIGVFKIKL